MYFVGKKLKLITSVYLYTRIKKSKNYVAIFLKQICIFRVLFFQKSYLIKRQTDSYTKNFIKIPLHVL